MLACHAGDRGSTPLGSANLGVIMIIQLDSKLTQTVDSLRPSRADIVRRAITLLKLVVDENKRGNKVVLIAKDGMEREILV